MISTKTNIYIITTKKSFVKKMISKKLNWKSSFEEMISLLKKKMKLSIFKKRKKKVEIVFSKNDLKKKFIIGNRLLEIRFPPKFKILIYFNTINYVYIIKRNNII